MTTTNEIAGPVLDFSGWDAMVIEGLERELGEQHIVARTARRIVAKGLSLDGASKSSGFREGFNWGRSSHAVTTRVIWDIGFTDNVGGTFNVVLVGGTTTYTKCNPYDRVPATSGKTSWSIQAIDESRAALGWKIEHAE